MTRFARARKILRAELETVRRRLDLDAGEVTAFTLPLLGRAALIVLIGVVPLIVVRMGDDADEVFVPVVASFALATVCAAVITWRQAAIVISALVTVVLYRKPPRLASSLVVRTIDDSFGRISAATSDL